MKPIFDFLLIATWCALLSSAGDYYQTVGLFAMALGFAVISVD